CAFGALNGVVIAGYCLMRRPPQTHYLLLGSAMFALSVRVLKSALYVFNPDVSLAVLQLGLMAAGLIGPLFYFYALSVSGQLESQRVPWKLHLGALVLGLCVVGLAFPFDRYPELWRAVIYKVTMFGWVAYQLAAMAALRETWRKALKNWQSLTRDEAQAVCVVGGVFVVCLTYATSAYTSYLFATVSMSVLLLAGFIGVMTLKAEKPKYGGRTVAEAPDLIAALDLLMAETKLFTNPDLTLAAVAKRLNQPKATLSQVINESLGMTFTTYINQLRVKEAEQTLRAAPDISLEELAEISGFNSQSTLYAAFKRIGGTTPGAVRKHHKTAGEHS
ncbi:MAG: helix-turn-helix domain-containing protein, partial [Pseudomonadota bacterium]